MVVRLRFFDVHSAYAPHLFLSQTNSLEQPLAAHLFAVDGQSLLSTAARVTVSQVEQKSMPIAFSFS